MERRELRAVVATVLLTAGLLAWWLVPGSAPRRLDWWPTTLAMSRAMPKPPSTEEVTVVLIDDESLSRLKERWPIDRARWAQLIDVLAGMSPAAIGIDAWFENPAPRPEVELARDVVDRLDDSDCEEEDTEEVVTFLEKLAKARDGDRRLAEAIANAGVVTLGFACQAEVEDARQDSRVEGLTTVEGVPETHGHLVPCPHLTGSFPALTSVAHGQAALTVAYDADGRIRRYPYVVRGGGQPRPSLALALAQTTRPAEAEAMTRRALARDRAAPLLWYRPSARFRHVRFSDVLEAGADSKALAEAVRGRIVLVGVSALGTEDFVDAPLEGDVPGVFVHANAVANLLADAAIATEGPLVRGVTGAGALLLALLAFALRKRERPSQVLSAAVVVFVLWSAAAVAALRAGYAIPIVPMWLGVLGLAGVRLYFRYQRSEAARRQAREIRRAFDQYLAPEVVEALVEAPERLRLGGERREITAFFSDIKGFTTISETMDPADLVQLLNECLGTMTTVILEEGGIIDKYIGDAIVAMFGAPFDQPDHAAKACRAAVRCQEALDGLREDWAARGLPDVRVRIGLNSGPALVGNLGSDQRYDYTMVGDTVNLAARLEGINNVYGTWIMCGDETARLAAEDRELHLRELDLVRVKGKLQGVRVFEVAALGTELSTARRDLQARFAPALAAYREGRFAEARAAFAPLAEGGDPASQVFLERCEAFEAEPPPEDWGGVFVMTTKG